MSGHPTYQPQSAFMRWMERRLPIAGLVYSSFIVYPTPRNLNYWWTFGGVLAFMLGAQIITGIVLAMHYTPHVDYAFNSVEQIMRDVNYGWLLRYLHANGASMFFLGVLLPRQALNTLTFVNALSRYSGYSHLSPSEAYQFFCFPLLGLLLLTAALWRLRLYSVVQEPVVRRTQ